LNYGSIA